MPDREKVIEALRLCRENFSTKSCRKCPYMRGRDGTGTCYPIDAIENGMRLCWQDLVDDALALLKEQEAKKGVIIMAELDGILRDMEEEIDEWRGLTDSELAHGLTVSCEWYRALYTWLKGLSPRLLTAEEMEIAGRDGDAVFAECGDGKHRWVLATEGIEPPEDRPFNYPGGVRFNAIDADGEILDGDFYGMDHHLGWRAWSAKPTPDQMRDTPWEETENG